MSAPGVSTVPCDYPDGRRVIAETADAEVGAALVRALLDQRGIDRKPVGQEVEQ